MNINERTNVMKLAMLKANSDCKQLGAVKVSDFLLSYANDAFIASEDMHMFDDIILGTGYIDLKDTFICAYMASVHLK